MESVLSYEQSKQAGLIKLDKLVSIVVRGCVAFEKGQMSNTILSGSSTQSFKGFLSQLRELSVAADGLSLRSASHRSLVQNLLRTAREMPDRDVERKVCRICAFLISTVLNSSSSSGGGGGGKLEPSVASSLFDFLNLEVIKGSGSRQAFAIKALSQIALPCGRLEESINTISQLILRSRYPTHRKVVLLGQKKADRDYEIALQLWSAVMVAFRSLKFAPSASFDEVLFTASQSENAVLARHSLSLIASAALEREDLPETQRQRSVSSSTTSGSLSPGTSSSNLDQSKTSLATKLLAKIRIGSVQFHDSLALAYVFKAVSTFASSHSVPIELVAELYDELFLKLRDKVSSGTMSGAKATSDFLQSFIGHSRVDELKAELAKPKHYLDLLSHLTQAVDRYVLALDLGSVAAPVLLRSAAAIGRFLLSQNDGTEMEEAQHLLLSILTKLDSYGPLRLAFHPHAFRDALRALLWLLPNSSVPLWEDFVKRVLASNVQLGENLSLGLFDSFFDRVFLCIAHEARTNERGGNYTFYVKILLHYADALVSRFGSRGACDRLDRTWDWLSGLIFSDEKDSAQQLSVSWRCGIKSVFLDSLMLFLDLPKGHGAQQSLRGKVFFQLAEHVFACQDMQDPEAGVNQSALEIVNVVLFGALTETGPTKLLCLQGLTMIVVRLHIIVRLSRSSKPERILGELVVRLTELVVDARGARGVIFRPECGCCVSVAGGNSELRCLWALGALPLPPCSVCKDAAAVSQLEPSMSSSLSGATLSPSLIVGGNLSRVFEISTWAGIGHGNSLGVGTAAINTMRQLEALKAGIHGILVDEQEEAVWSSVCRFTDFRFDAWRSSLTSHDAAGSLPYVSLRRGSNSSVSDEVTVTLLPLPTAVTVTPTKVLDYSLLQLDDLLPPPPCSPAPAIPPKPQRPATATTMSAAQDIFSFEQSFQLPPPPPPPPPPLAPAPPMISPQPSFDAYDSQSSSFTPDRRETFPEQTPLYMPHQSTLDAFANIPLPPQQPQALGSSSSFDHFASLAPPAPTVPGQQAFLSPSLVLSPSADSVAATTSAPAPGRRPSLIPSPSTATATGTGVGKSPLIAPPPSTSSRSNRRK